MKKHTFMHKSRRFRRFLRANKAVSALEYAMLVGIIAVAVGAAIAIFGGDVDTAIQAIGDRVGAVDTGAIPVAPAPSPF